MAVVEIHGDKCKGCGYCVFFCKRGALEMAAERNAFGLNFAQVSNMGRCNLCLNCIRMCPDLAISLYDDSGKEAAHG